jgi:hypothetical protein
MESLSQESRVLATCKSCGGDPGGIVFEGLVLTGMLTADDIVALLRGALDRRTVVRLFTKRILHGTKVKRQWLTRASHFVADWEQFEARCRLPVRVAPTRATVVEVARRVR